MTHQLILADENDEKWHCDKKHRSNNPEKNCDHPWHILKQTIQQHRDSRNKHESALTFLQTFLEADPRIQ
ncbi:hypothetical protein HDU76_005533, partial [Blyttiomyces sp. JEL0837]